MAGKMTPSMMYEYKTRNAQRNAANKAKKLARTQPKAEMAEMNTAKFVTPDQLLEGKRCLFVHKDGQYARTFTKEMITNFPEYGIESRTLVFYKDENGRIFSTILKCGAWRVKYICGTLFVYDKFNEGTEYIELKWGDFPIQLKYNSFAAYQEAAFNSKIKKAS